MTTFTDSACTQAGVLKRRSALQGPTWPGWYLERHQEVLTEDKHLWAFSLPESNEKSQCVNKFSSSQSSIPAASPAN